MWAIHAKKLIFCPIRRCKLLQTYAARSQLLIALARNKAPLLHQSDDRTSWCASIGCQIPIIIINGGFPKRTYFAQVRYRIRGSLLVKYLVEEIQLDRHQIPREPGDRLMLQRERRDILGHGHADWSVFEVEPWRELGVKVGSVPFRAWEQLWRNSDEKRRYRLVVVVIIDWDVAAVGGPHVFSATTDVANFEVAPAARLCCRHLQRYTKGFGSHCLGSHGFGSFNTGKTRTQRSNERSEAIIFTVSWKTSIRTWELWDRMAYIYIALEQPTTVRFPKPITPKPNWPDTKIDLQVITNSVRLPRVLICSLIARVRTCISDLHRATSRGFNFYSFIYFLLCIIINYANQ